MVARSEPCNNPPHVWLCCNAHTQESPSFYSVLVILFRLDHDIFYFSITLFILANSALIRRTSFKFESTN